MRKLAYILSLILIFTIPWEDAVTIADLNSITRYVGIIAAGVWVVSKFFSGKVRKPHIFHILVILFILWNIASLSWTMAYDYTYKQSKTYLQLIILTLIIWDLYTTSKALNNAMQAYILGCYVAIITTFNNFILGREIRLYSGGRYAGVGNAVELALILAIGLPIAWHLATSLDNQNKNKILRLINFAYLPAALLAILLTGTRMAIFAVIPALAYIIGTFYRLKPIVRFSSLVVLIGAGFWLEPLIPRSTLERLGTTGVSIVSGDLGGRVSIWLKSLSFFYSHPIVGIGSGALSSNYVMGVMAHNTFLSVLTEVGLIGFVLFMAILVVITQQALKQEKYYAMLWIIILAIWTIGVFTLTWEYKKATWLILTLIIVGANLNNRQIGQENRASSLPKSKIMLNSINEQDSVT
jgi:O-antigen ligase